MHGIKKGRPPLPPAAKAAAETGRRVTGHAITHLLAADLIRYSSTLSKCPAQGYTMRTRKRVQNALFQALLGRSAPLLYARTSATQEGNTRPFQRRHARACRAREEPGIGGLREFSIEPRLPTRRRAQGRKQNNGHAAVNKAQNNPARPAYARRIGHGTGVWDSPGLECVLTVVYTAQRRGSQRSARR